MEENINDGDSDDSDDDGTTDMVMGIIEYDCNEGVNKLAAVDCEGNYGDNDCSGDNDGDSCVTDI